MKLQATLNVEVDFFGRETTVRLQQLTEEEAASRGIRLINPELTASIIGVGKARCRKDDHYEEVVGLEIATARALADYASQAEERAVAVVRSERQAAVEASLNELGSLVESMIRPITRLAELADPT